MGSTPAGTATAPEEQAGVSDDGTPQVDVSDSALPGAHGDTPAGDGDPAQPESEDASAIAILGQDAFNAVKDDPKKLAKALHKSYTQRMQGLSRDADFVEAFRGNPEGTLKQLAEQYGLDLQPKPGAAQQTTDDVHAALSETIGEEAARALMPAIEKLIDRKIAPMQQQTAALDRESALHAANALIERFEAKRPDFKQFEKRMEEFGGKVKPSPGMDEMEYMEILYSLAKGDSAVAERAETSINRMKSSAKAGERPATGVSNQRVAVVPANGKVSFDDAWEAAKRNIVFDPDEIRAARRSKK